MWRQHRGTNFYVKCKIKSRIFLVLRDWILSLVTQKREGQTHECVMGMITLTAPLHIKYPKTLTLQSYMRQNANSLMKSMLSIAERKQLLVCFPCTKRHKTSTYTNMTLLTAIQRTFYYNYTNASWIKMMCRQLYLLCISLAYEM